MSVKQEQYKKSLIQKIQMSKSKVFLDDESRRDFMKSRFGVDSTTKLSIDQLKLLLDFCNRKVNDIPLLNMATSAQVAKIYEFWRSKARDINLNALYAFIYRITKSHVNTVAELTKGEATKIIVALEKFS